jgi:hypothetical protein
MANNSTQPIAEIENRLISLEEIQKKVALVDDIEITFKNIIQKINLDLTKCIEIL